MTQLQILVTLGPEPAPGLDPTKAHLVVRYASSWNMNGTVQPTAEKDRLVVASVLKQAHEIAMQNVPYDPPTILQGVMPPPGVQ